MMPTVVSPSYNYVLNGLEGWQSRGLTFNPAVVTIDWSPSYITPGLAATDMQETFDRLRDTVYTASQTLHDLQTEADNMPSPRINHRALVAQIHERNFALVPFTGTDDQARALRRTLNQHLVRLLTRSWLNDNGYHLHYMLDDSYITISLSTTSQLPYHFTDLRETPSNWLVRRGRPPRSYKRRFGVELEIVGLGQDEAADALRRAGINARSEGYNHTTRNYWKVVDDASLSSSTGRHCEVVSPPLSGDEGRAQLALVMRTLREAGGDVNRTCGTHVHVEMRNLSGIQIASLIEFYVKRQAQIDRLMTRSRRSEGGSEWCRAYYEDELDSVLRAFRRDARSQIQYAERYRTVNVTCFPRYGTLEFRQHAGTLDFEKLVHWIDFLCAATDAAQGTLLSNLGYSLSEFISGLSLDTDWYLERVEALA